MKKIIIILISIISLSQMAFQCDHDYVTKEMVMKDLNIPENYTIDQATNIVRDFVADKVPFFVVGYTCKYSEDPDCPYKAKPIYHNKFDGHHYRWEFTMYNKMISGTLPALSCSAHNSAVRYLLEKLEIKTRLINMRPDYSLHPGFCPERTCGHTAAQYLNSNSEWVIIDSTPTLDQNFLYFPVEWLKEIMWLP